MTVYGLTGVIGAGKSTVSNIFQEFGIAVVLADKVGRQVVSQGSDGFAEIVATFGHNMLNSTGELDRRKLGKLIFDDSVKRHQLENILHPRIRQYSRKLFNELENAGNQIVIYESALLFEAKRHTEMRGVIFVAASEENRIARVQARDGCDEGEARSRMRAQMNEEAKRKFADYIIDNNGDIQALRHQVSNLISQLLKAEQEGL
jgi:dephospho-CoA kinase